MFEPPATAVFLIRTATLLQNRNDGGLKKAESLSSGRITEEAG
jgi:hypothetical protein